MDEVLKERKMAMGGKGRWCSGGLLIATAVLWAGYPGVRAENAPSQQEIQPRHGFRVAQPELLPLPGFYMLRMENVQKELNLTPEQLAQLTELSKTYSEQVRADQELWKDWQKMSPEERSAKAAEQRQRYAQRVQDVRQQVEKILQPPQIKTLQQIVLRTQGWWVLYQPQIQESLGLTPEQKQLLGEIRQNMFEEIQEVQRKAFEKAYAVLQKEQQEKLLQEVQKRTH